MKPTAPGAPIAALARLTDLVPPCRLKNRMHSAMHACAHLYNMFRLGIAGFAQGELCSL